MTDEQIIRAVAETWAPIPNYNGYDVSTYGRVRSWKHKAGKRKTAHIMKLNNTGRYFMVQLHINEKPCPVSVHRLVLTAFVGPCPCGMTACHNDGNGFNNRVDNLRWGTMTSNIQDKVRHGTMACGSKQGSSKLNESQVHTIRELYDLGMSINKLAANYKVNKTTIYRIVSRQSWRHI